MKFVDDDDDDDYDLIMYFIIFSGYDICDIFVRYFRKQKGF